MGFQHVELMVEGHNHWPPMKPPRGQHYERWYHADGRGEELQRLYETQLRAALDARCRPGIRRCRSRGTTRPGSATARSSSCKSNHEQAVLRLGVVSRSAPSVRRARAVEPAAPPGRGRPAARARTLDLERRPWWHRQSLEGKPQIVEHLRKFREQYSRMPVQTDQQLRELTANYYGMISLIDHNVGRILAGARRLGLPENTLVVYSTDHGDWLGDHGLILKGPMAYEGLLRVGLLVAGPGVPAGQGRAPSRSPRSTCRRRFADYAGVALRAGATAAACVPLIEGDGDAATSPTANGTCARRAAAST